MKIKYYISILFIILSGTIFGQYRYMYYEPFEMEGYIPKWIYIVIDSTLTEVIPTSGDSIVHDGWLHFSGADPMKDNKPFLNNEDLYIFEIRSYNFFEGGFVAKLDLNSGTKIWAAPFDLRNTDKRQYPAYISINNKGNLDVLVYIPRRDGIPWSSSYMGIRHYDAKNGELINFEQSDPNDSLNLRMYAINPGYSGSRLFPEDNNYRYINYYNRGTYLKYESYLIDKNGHVLKDTFAERPFDLLIEVAYCKKISDDKILNIRRTTVQNPLNRKDTFKLYFEVLGMDNLEEIVYKEITNEVPAAYHHELIEASDDHFIIRSSDFVLINSEYVRKSYLTSFDIEGNIIENIALVNEDSSPMYGDFAYGIKLKYEKGMLIFVSGKTEDDHWKMSIYKSDGNGNINKLKEIKITPTNHQIVPAKVYQLENGDILFNGMDFNHNYVYGLATFFAKFYMYIPASDLGLKTSTEELTLSNNINIPLYPNPTKNRLNISSVKENFNKIIIFDSMGKVVYQEKCNEGNNFSVNIGFLNKGMYIIKVYLNKNEIGINKFVKE